MCKTGEYKLHQQVKCCEQKKKILWRGKPAPLGTEFTLHAKSLECCDWVLRQNVLGALDTGNTFVLIKVFVPLLLDVNELGKCKGYYAYAMLPAAVDFVLCYWVFSINQPSTAMSTQSHQIKAKQSRKPKRIQIE